MSTVHVWPDYRNKTPYVLFNSKLRVIPDNDWCRNCVTYSHTSKHCPYSYENMKANIKTWINNSVKPMDYHTLVNNILDMKSTQTRTDNLMSIFNKALDDLITDGYIGSGYVEGKMSLGYEEESNTNDLIFFTTQQYSD